MVLGVMEGQIRGGYFPDYILDPSVIDCNAHALAKMCLIDIAPIFFFIFIFISYFFLLMFMDKETPTSL